MKKILVYCQHVLGIGHLARMAAVLKEMENCAKVTLVLGGPKTALAFPEYVDIVQLPALHMDAEFSGLQPVDDNCSLEVIKEQRKAQLLELVDSLQPDVLLIELFPFGRCGFRFELDPLLHHVRTHHKTCRVICSVRDILVERERENQLKFERRVVERLNGFFDLLLVHADPDVILLDKTFSRGADIQIPVRYTGYIAEKSERESCARLRQTLRIESDEKLVVVSAGSGSVGIRLLESALAAHAILSRERKVRLQLFSGPYLPADRFAILKEMASPGAVVARFTDHFADWLTLADLSVSMGGYNTTMNVMAAGCPALIFPFLQNQEQGMRAQRLAGMVPLQVLAAKDLSADHLAGQMEIMMQKQSYEATFSLDGAGETARLLLAEGEVSNGKR